MENIQEERGLSFLELLQILKKNLILILIITVSFTVIGFLYGTFVKSYTYTAKGTMIVQVNQGNSSSGNFDSYYDNVTSILLTNSFIEMADSKRVAEACYKRCGTELTTINSASAILSGINAWANQDSAVINISFTCGNKADVLTVIDNYMDAFIAEINSVDNTTGVDNFPSYKNRLVIFDKPGESDVRASRGAKKTILLAFAVGLVVSFIVVAIRYALDDTITNKEAFEKTYKTNVIALIPNVKGNTNERGEHNE